MTGETRGRKPALEITDPQRRTLDQIRRLTEHQGVPPTIQELADALDISHASAHEQVSQLVRKGYLRRRPGKARSVTIVRRSDEAEQRPDRVMILRWLRERDPEKLEPLWEQADRIRRENVGDEVHLRGLLEISNYCVRRCAYCGLAARNRALKRYRMSVDEILEGARRAAGYGYGTVVLQAGEDYGLTRRAVEEAIRRIKRETPLAVTLSLGERPDEDLVAWREAGADRYLLRLETTDRALYDLIHPPHAGRRSDRVAILHRLRELGYEIGSGVMIGIPGQSWQTLATDIETFGALDLDMIGVGPYIAHPDTPLGAGTVGAACGHREQVPADELTTYRVLALTRLVCPEANIPSTTALATLNRTTGRELGLARGANVVMPNVTPPAYRAMYEIYPGKACINETAEACHACMTARIQNAGRRVGLGRGDRTHRS